MAKNRINKVTHQQKVIETPVVVDGNVQYTVRDEKGNDVGKTYVKAGTDVSNAQFNYFKKKDDGTWEMSDTPETNISLNTETGRINISAPADLTNSDLFKQVVDYDRLKDYEAAYKTNKDYKLEVWEKDEESGEQKRKEVTIPEYIERLNSGLQNYAKNIRYQRIQRKSLQDTYGDKVNNMTDAQVVMTTQGEKGAKATYLPNIVLNADSFGNGIKNPFLKLKDKVSEGGEISAKDLEDAWTRNNFGREEVAALMAMINGTLNGSDWNKDSYYKDADGNDVYNTNSAEEMGKLLAFKNFVLNNNPKAEWYQQAGDWIESAALNFTNAFTGVFTNLAVMAEGALDILPGVEAHAILDWRNEADQTINNYNAINAQAWDAVVNAQIWGSLAGTAAGTFAASHLGKTISKDLSKAADRTRHSLVYQSQRLATEAGAIEEGSAAWQALTPRSLTAIYESAEEVSLGMRLWMHGLDSATRAAIATNTALSAISGAKESSDIVGYLFDTFHDAVLYDGTTLRNLLTAVAQDDSNENRQEVLNYWMGQFVENAKFWIPIGTFRYSMKKAGKTDFGKAANAVTTRFVNKVVSDLGSKKQSIKDKLAGGSVVKKLERDIDNAIKKNNFTKAMRLERKLDIENWNTLTREARSRLGKLDLKWDGAKLTEESLEEFNNFVGDVKALENGIDAYNRDIFNKIDEMTIKQVDPVTGKRRYLNPELGEANATATMYYWDLVDLAKKHGLTVAKDSMLPQDVIDYWMNSYYKGLADSFASGKGVNATQAKAASETLQKNIDALKEVVPEEIRNFVDNMLSRKIYQKWYFAQNDYGMAKGLLNRERMLGYQNGPVWQENGYIPIKVQHDVKGHWISDDGRIDAVIEQDFKSLTFEVAEGQHYVDPEMVRQTRLKKMAQAEVNKDLFKAYNGFTHSALNDVKVSGEETAYVDRVNRNMASLEDAIDKYAPKAFRGNFVVEAVVGKSRKPTKNVRVASEETRSTIVSGMSRNQTSWFLVRKHVLSRRGAKLTDDVTAANFDEWYSGQNSSVRKFLQAKKDGKAVNNEYVGLSSKEIDDEIAKSRKNIKELSKDTVVYDDLETEIQSLTPVTPTKLDSAIEAQKRAGTTNDALEAAISKKKYVPEEDQLEAAIREQSKTPEMTSTLESSIEAQEKTKNVIPSEQDLEKQVEIAAEREKIKKLQEAKTYEKVGYEDLQNMISEGGDEFESELQRAYLIGDESFAKSSVMNEAARNLENGKDAFYQGVTVARIKGETKNILKLDTEHFWDDMLSTLRAQVNNFVAMVVASPGAKAAIKALTEQINCADTAARYVSLRQLKKNGLGEIYKAIDDQIDGLKGTGKLLNEDVDLLKKKAHELVEDIIDTELNEATQAMKGINPDLVDSKDIYNKAKDLTKKIEGAEEKLDSNYIMYLDDEGRSVYAQVDPAFASLFNTRAKVTKAEASAMAKFNSYASRVFRYGTTSLNLAAFGNQLFRDTGNALLVGGAWQTIQTNAENMRDVFGDHIVEQLKKFEPSDYELRQVSRIAAESGQSLQEAAVSRELMRGAAIAETTTETSLYRDFMKQAYGSNPDMLLTNMKGKLQELWEKYDPDKYMNGKRENYLRNRVYASSLNDALTQGYSLRQARTFAEFAMNNATTNFSRQLYHMQAIADSTPYFRAAINGTKSFWRMWSLDPVGISGRVMGGLILPVMFLVGASLGDSKNREVYKNLPEYQKKDSLVFVINGQAVSIPIPQEMSAIVAPFRQFVEYLHGANENDFWELMTNDLLGFSPVDLTGFTKIDYDSMIEDPNFFDRTSRGISRVFSQMAPISLKTAYMLASGTDPYTGKWLRDPSYTYWNSETNSLEVMDYYQSTFASFLAKLFPNMNPAVADKVISGVFGSTGSNVLSDITALFQEGIGGWANSAREHVVEQFSKPFTVEEYDMVDAIWKRAVRQLSQEKNNLLATDEMKTLNTKLAQTKDPDERNKLLSERQNLTDNYINRVASMVERLGSEYNGTLDRNKFAAVVALLNFNSDSSYQTGSQYSSNIASEEYWNGNDEAIHTMERMGIQGTEDMSIFGYLTVDKNGNPVMKYSSPVAIMDMQNQWENQDDINAANIKAILSENNMYDAHKAISDQISAIYDSKKKLTNQDYANIEAIQINWNAELVKKIAPYVSRMTPEAAINNTEVMNALYPYVEVPNSWETNNYNKRVSLGSKGNKKRAYYESWIRSMFNVNDKYKGQY